MTTDRRRRRRFAGIRVWHVVLGGSAFAMSFPVLWGVVSSFKPANEIYSPVPFIQNPTVDNYARVLADWPVALLVGNTTVMAAGVAIGQVVIAVLAAFALVHIGVRGKRTLMALMAISLAVPPQALIIPQFIATARLGWLNTEAGLIVPQLGSSALAVLLLVQHVQAIPLSLVEAARIDGARPLQVLWHVVLPGLRPAIAAVFVLVFITTWNDYLWPLIVAPRTEDTTVQIGLTQFITAEGNDYGGLLAAAMLTSLPIVLVYLVASRRITDAFLQAGLR
ncbi:carbohydrate ABC transporter permease [Okibacterium endophyticum]